MTFVPFPGTAPAINTLMGGHLTAVFADYPTVVGHLKSGTLRGLVTASAKRVPDLPDVPTFAEAGVTAYDADIFYGIVAPEKTPPEALKQLGDWFSAALKVPEVQPRLAQQGLFPVGMCGTPFGEFMRRLTDDYAKIIREVRHKGELSMIRTPIAAALLLVAVGRPGRRDQGDLRQRHARGHRRDAGAVRGEVRPQAQRHGGRDRRDPQTRARRRGLRRDHGAERRVGRLPQGEPCRPPAARRR